MNRRWAPPANSDVLDGWIADMASAKGVDAARHRMSIAVMLLAEAFGRVKDHESKPHFLLKGGFLMELHFPEHARASLDMDLAFRAAGGTLGRKFDEAVLLPLGPFSFRHDGGRRIRDTAAYRYRVTISLAYRDWETVQVEVGPAEGAEDRWDEKVPDPRLTMIGLDFEHPVACITLSVQVAQKLHACTEVPATGKTNDRYRDLVDLALIGRILPDDDYATVRADCEHIFAGRAQQPWPPTITIHDSWRNEFPLLADRYGFPVRDVEVAAAAIDALIARIASA